jgi:hypothetical protein
VLDDSSALGGLVFVFRRVGVADVSGFAKSPHLLKPVLSLSGSDSLLEFFVL